MTRREKLRAIHALQRQGAAAAAKFLHDVDPIVRLEAINCLRDHADKRSAATAARVVREETDDLVVTSALECLVRWESRRSADVVAKLLSAPSALTRCYAAWALGNLGSARHVPLLRRRFPGARSEGSAIAEALFMLTGSKRYLDHLLDQLQSDDPEVRAFTSNSLVGALTKKNFPRIIGALATALAAERSAAIAPHIAGNLELAVDNALYLLEEEGALPGAAQAIRHTARRLVRGNGSQ